MHSLFDAIRRRVDPNWRRHRLVGPPHLWRMKRAFQKGFLLEQGLSPTSRFLDFGCGTLRGGIPIIRHLERGRYTGIDIRPEVLQEARAELRRHGLEGKGVRLLKDPSGLASSARFDVVWAFSVLFHLTNEELDAFLALLERHLAPSGVAYANVNRARGRQGEWRDFPVEWRGVREHQDRSARYGLVVEDLGPLKELGHRSGHPDQDAQRMLRWARSSP